MSTSEQLILKLATVLNSFISEEVKQKLIGWFIYIFFNSSQTLLFQYLVKKNEYYSCFECKAFSADDL